ncbi:hypothetical protein VAR608DRAFT_5687 [Variovorax sp. HW608]|nr:hypothetical protein VAR608DRAFT_5687 [Variovorax sp. HW608]
MDVDIYRSITDARKLVAVPAGHTMYIMSNETNGD